MPHYNDRPIKDRVNGYDIIQSDDGTFGAWDDDEMLTGPFDTIEEAQESARKLPSRIPPSEVVRKECPLAQNAAYN